MQAGVSLALSRAKTTATIHLSKKKRDMKSVFILAWVLRLNYVQEKVRKNNVARCRQGGRITFPGSVLPECQQEMGRAYNEGTRKLHE